MNILTDLVSPETEQEILSVLPGKCSPVALQRVLVEIGIYEVIYKEAERKIGDNVLTS